MACVAQQGVGEVVQGAGAAVGQLGAQPVDPTTMSASRISTSPSV
ncbi:hypothetical protein [Streptomyces albicerus]|nr:hypothetical protein [Streptomyces albicerus]